MQRELYPVVGVFELPVQPLTYRAIRDGVFSGAHRLSVLMAEGGVKPMQLLHIEEVELLEMAAAHGRSVADILRAKTATPDTTEMSFHHYIHMTGETFSHGHGPWHAERFRVMMSEMNDLYATLGMPLRDGDATDG